MAGRLFRISDKPFGSKLFTNLVHYVRSGDFVESLIRNARDPNEYAFALGALAHYASDNAGHAISVNRALPIEYPRLRAKFGDEVLFAEAPARHLMLEFAFDVYQIGAAGYASQAYRDFIGFEVAKSLLARASKETYALDLDELFPNQDMAIGTYRHAISTTIPHLTLLAWKDKQKEIRARTPGIERSRFVFTFTQVEYDRTFGTTYKKPGLLSRFVVVLFKILPKFGAFRTLAFKPLTPETAKLFVESFEAARERYRASLQSLLRNRGSVANTDLDTGRAPVRAHNTLLEETYADLLAKLAKRQFAGVPLALRADIVRHYAAPLTVQLTRKERKVEEGARRDLATLQANAR